MQGLRGLYSELDFEKSKLTRHSVMVFCLFWPRLKLPLNLKAGFRKRRRSSWSCNQKRRAKRSSENQTDGVGSRTLILLVDQVKTALSESQAEAEE